MTETVPSRPAVTGEEPVATQLPDGAVALLAAFEAVARERGLRDVGLRSVARRAGLSHAAPAHFFGGFAGMVQAFAVQAARVLGRAVDQSRAATAGQSGPHRLAAEGVAVVDFALAHPVHFDVLFRPGVPAADPVVTAVREEAFRCLLEVVREALEAGELEGDDATALALELWATTIGLCSMLLDDLVPGARGDAARERVVALLRRQADRMAGR